MWLTAIYFQNMALVFSRDFSESILALSSAYGQNCANQCLVGCSEQYIMLEEGNLTFPATCRMSRPIFKPETAFDSPMHELPEYILKFHLKVIDDVTSEVQRHIANRFPWLALPGKVTV